MLVKRLRAVFDKKGPWAGIVNRTTVVYYEDGRKMTVAGEMLIDGFEIYVSSIAGWDDGRGGPIDDSERARILSNRTHSQDTRVCGLWTRYWISGD
jgi:hypothetical protein